MTQFFKIQGSGSSWTYTVIEANGVDSFTSGSFATYDLAAADMFANFGGQEISNFVLSAPTGTGDSIQFFVNGDKCGLFAAGGPTATPFMYYSDSNYPVWGSISDENQGIFTVYGSARVRMGLADRVLYFASVGGTIDQTFTQKGNTAATDTSLWSPMGGSIPADTLGTNGDTLELWAAGSIPVLVTPVTIAVKFGATTLISRSVAASQGTGGSWNLFARIMRTGAATQKGTCILTSTASTGIGISVTAYATPAETLSGTTTLDVRATGTNANDVVFEFGKLSWVPAA